MRSSPSIVRSWAREAVKAPGAAAPSDYRGANAAAPGVPAASRALPDPETVQHGSVRAPHLVAGRGWEPLQVLVELVDDAGEGRVQVRVVGRPDDAVLADEGRHGRERRLVQVEGDPALAL